MITGYNHNIKHSGRMYHIQTEDSGLQYPHIITHLFVGGNIIHSHKRSYAHLLEENLHENEEEFEATIRGMMKEQHKKMLKELKSGAHDHVGSKKSSGALLTPGLLSIQGEEAKKAEDAAGQQEAVPVVEEVAPLSSEDIFEDADPVEVTRTTPPHALIAVDASSAITTQKMPLFEVPQTDVGVQISSAQSSPTTEHAPESSSESAEKASTRRGSRSRLGRSRPAFAAPPPTPATAKQDTPTAPSVDLFSRPIADNDATLLDIRAFGHGAPMSPTALSSAPHTPTISSAPDTPSLSTRPKRPSRSRRGSGRGRRPEMQFAPPTDVPASQAPAAPSPVEPDASPTLDSLPAVVHSPDALRDSIDSSFHVSVQHWLASSKDAPQKKSNRKRWGAESQAQNTDTIHPDVRARSANESLDPTFQKIASAYLKKDEHT